MSKKPNEGTLNITNNITPNVSVSNVSSAVKEAAKKRLNELMQEEMKTVKGVFQNFETPGGNLKLTVKKYPGHVFEKTMEDGGTYEVPLYIARHLNGVDITAGDLSGSAEKNPRIGTCSYPKHGFVVPGRGAEPAFGAIGGDGIPVPIVGIVKRVKRFGFQSLEFDCGAA